MVLKTLQAIAVGTAAFVCIAAVTPADGNYKVRNSGGVDIGNATVSGGGSLIAYVDNPNTSHPPDSDAVWTDDDGDTCYTEAGTTNVVKFKKGPGNGYTWIKKNAAGAIVDAGTLQDS